MGGGKYRNSNINSSYEITGSHSSAVPFSTSSSKYSIKGKLKDTGTTQGYVSASYRF